MKSVKQIARSLFPESLWRAVRRRKIVSAHRRVAGICETLLSGCEKLGVSYKFEARHHFDTDRIIWQYWSQGYESLPPVVEECLKSVERYCADYTIVRLDDSNLSEYLEFPDWFDRKRRSMSHAHFSDVLRLALLETYGGIWMDATIRLTGPIPEEIGNMPFFVFRRDDSEPDKKYWESTYAYYFGWGDGFKVRMLNSFIVSRRGEEGVAMLLNCLLEWWRNNDSLPDYFFFQILYEVMVGRGYHSLDCKIISDTLPHYMQQSINDARFSLIDVDRIPGLCAIHKLTYKNEVD